MYTMGQLIYWTDVCLSHTTNNLSPMFTMFYHELFRYFPEKKKVYHSALHLVVDDSVHTSPSVNTSGLFISAGQFSNRLYSYTFNFF